MTSSYWLSEPWAVPDGARDDERVDVAVVGGGVTGCACAHVLAGAGLRVRVHEAREIAGGASGRNGGFALRGGALTYDVARAQLGPERARALWQLTERYLERLAELAGDAFRRTGSLRLAADAPEVAELEAEYEALREDGFAVEQRAELGEALAGRFQGAIFHPPDGALQPARWARCLAARAAEAGAQLREDRRIEALAELGADPAATRSGSLSATPATGTSWGSRAESSSRRQSLANRQRSSSCSIPRGSSPPRVRGRGSLSVLRDRRRSPRAGDRGLDRRRRRIPLRAACDAGPRSCARASSRDRLTRARARPRARWPRARSPGPESQARSN